MAMLAVVQTVNDYGATQDEELAVPWTRRMDHPPGPARNNTTKLLLTCILGMTAVVASSALVLVSLRESTAGPTRTATNAASFLLRDNTTCVAGSGPWPTGTENVDDDANTVISNSYIKKGSAYTTCFALKDADNDDTIGHCWSKSFMDSYGNWQPCKPNGFKKTDESKYWVYGRSLDYIGDKDIIGECGTACTDFASDQNDDI